MSREFMWDIILVLVLFGLLLPSMAWATEYSETNITNNYPNTITSGVSDRELAAGMAMSMASGGHELDFSTQDNQISITYALQIDNEDESAYSIKYGRRWDKFAQALWHVTYTPEQSEDVGDFVIFGGTLRF